METFQKPKRKRSKSTSFIVSKLQGKDAEFSSDLDNGSRGRAAVLRSVSRSLTLADGLRQCSGSLPDGSSVNKANPES